MSAKEKKVRRSLSLPGNIARRVATLAKQRNASANRVLLELIQKGLESAQNERERFFAMADRLAAAKEPAEIQKLKEDLARMTFGK